ncbi:MULTISPECIES: sodium:calcium antiporter [Halomonadaceae]|jgi:cation:H+ antiporter|uniref:Sodium:calcium antiporter n=1 Tax=Vreelandella janggokensis TaxID=370767 RepID=A0ABT4IRQ7_9GAMM|nr:MULTISPECIES: sodium:calcium antiporter [Halomonas]MCZ0926353.1 sodium:calcium antiporter [Halomonas janggokensis]MCZ0928891.1 sodium:calcium antiporter [Halomonas janggokensis]MDR5885587.1 sodium:calcium antiporter [Halomonas janggokensis]QPL47850.1 sodium:calcium antiporter [Halomonas sp. A40-4]
MFTLLNDISLLAAFALFGFCAVVIGIVGTRLTRVVDSLADRTGLGEAIAGAVLLGMATSLSGIVVSVSSAWTDKPELAMSNALGGIAVQTLFLTIADMVYRRANLEHAAASLGNLIQGALLLCLLSLLLVGRFAPEWTFWQIHPITPLLFIAYLFGLRLIKNAHTRPMWSPTRTRETREDQPDEPSGKITLKRLWLIFLGLALAIGFTGWLLERSATIIAAETGLSQAAVGVLLTSVVTSLPELVTTIAAVRRGALTLAVAGIIGGNAFDTLFAAASDVAYRGGSIYHVIPNHVMLWVALTVLMTGVLMLGLLHRQEQGPGRIGFESMAIIGLYLTGIIILFN